MNAKDFDSALVDARVLACEKSMLYATLTMEGGATDDLYDETDEYGQWMGFVVYLFLGTLTDSNDERCSRQIKFAANAYFYYFLTHVKEYEVSFEKVFDMKGITQLLTLADDILGDRSENIKREDREDYRQVRADIRKRSAETNEN